jgi:hypothetical protein
MQRMDALDPALGSINVQPAMAQIDLSPTQRAKLLRTQTVPIRQQDGRAIPGRIAPTLTRSFNQPINFRFG